MLDCEYTCPIVYCELKCRSCTRPRLETPGVRAGDLAGTLLVWMWKRGDETSLLITLKSLSVYLPLVLHDRHVIS